MTGRRIGGEEIAALGHAFLTAGYEVLSASGRAPWRFQLIDNDIELIVNVYIWRLHPERHGGDYRTHLYRHSGRPFKYVEGERTLLLGWAEEQRVFVAWPFDHYSRAAQASTVRVSSRTLRAASAGGDAIPEHRNRARSEMPALAFTDAGMRHVMREDRRYWAPEGGDVTPIVRDRADFAQKRYVPGKGAERIWYSEWPSPIGLQRFDLDHSRGVPTSQRERKPVSSGIARSDEPGDPLPPREALEPGGAYLYWFGVGIQTGLSIDDLNEPLPVADLPEDARLSVRVFAFPDELQLGDEREGELELTPDGGARVTVPAGRFDRGVEPLDNALYFPFRAPGRKGAAHLRCHLYYGATLLQSRLVTCHIGRKPRNRDSLRSEVDYSIALRIDGAVIAQMPEHELSIHLNGDTDTHQLRFYAADGKERFAADSTLNAGVLQTGLKALRTALGEVSWGTKDDWDGDPKSYLYRSPGSKDQLRNDLVALAIPGANYYYELTKALAGGSNELKELEKVSVGPGRVQISSSTPELHIPANLFFDHKIETKPNPKYRYVLCPDFSTALDAAGVLGQSPCFTDGCAYCDAEDTVCPSGFWGFRHQIGWPVNGEAAKAVEIEGRVKVTAGQSTDPQIVLAAGHIPKVLALGEGAVAESREELHDLLVDHAPHLLYLYCHGGSTGLMQPFIEIGPPNSDGIDVGFIRNRNEYWANPPPRALVFINGCHTAALSPEETSGLVGALVDEAHAIGVIGTELTIFERLASDFAETLLPDFLDGSQTIGEAVRSTRLSLLKHQLNPLGLLYVPFVAADVRLEKS